MSGRCHRCTPTHRVVVNEQPKVSFRLWTENKTGCLPSCCSQLFSGERQSLSDGCHFLWQPSCFSSPPKQEPGPKPRQHQMKKNAQQQVLENWRKSSPFVSLDLHGTKWRRRRSLSVTRRSGLGSEQPDPFVSQPQFCRLPSGRKPRRRVCACVCVSFILRTLQ